jgi:hypothetical protein
MFNLEKANSNIENLCDLIEEYQAITKQFPVYDPDVDLDEVP